MASSGRLMRLGAACCCLLSLWMGFSASAQDSGLMAAHLATLVQNRTLSNGWAFRSAATSEDSNDKIGVIGINKASQTTACSMANGVD